MDETHSLLLNEEALEACPEQKRPVFIYEWLRYLDRILPITQREDLKNVQKELQQQLESRLHTVIGPPTRKLIARCIGRVYALTGDILSLNNLLNSCNDTLKVKDESPKAVQSKLAALACLSAVYDSMGRMAGRTIEDTLQIVKNWMGTAVAHSQAHIMNMLTSMIKALGPGDAPTYKKIQLLSTSMKPPPGAVIKAKSNQMVPVRPASVSDTLNCLESAFLRGGIGGFLKGSSSTFATTGRSDIRIGVSICYVELMREMGSVWLEKYLAPICKHLVELASKCGHLAYTQNAAHVTEALITRRCISFIFRQTVGSLLGENAQTVACKQLKKDLPELRDFDIDMEISPLLFPQIVAHQNLKKFGACLTEEPWKNELEVLSRVFESVKVVPPNIYESRRLVISNRRQSPLEHLL